MVARAKASFKIRSDWRGYERGVEGASPLGLVGGEGLTKQNLGLAGQTAEHVIGEGSYKKPAGGPVFRFRLTMRQVGVIPLPQVNAELTFLLCACPVLVRFSGPERGFWLKCSCPEDHLAAQRRFPIRESRPR